MPSNLELKKSLEQTKKQLVVKDTEIAELNAKIAKFFAAEEAAKNKYNSSKVEENVPVDVSVDIEPSSEIEPQVSMPILDNSLVNSNGVGTSSDSKDKTTEKKKKKRSPWNLYLW